MFEYTDAWQRMSTPFDWGPSELQHPCTTPTQRRMDAVRKPSKPLYTNAICSSKDMRTDAHTRAHGHTTRQ